MMVSVVIESILSRGVNILNPNSSILFSILVNFLNNLSKNELIKLMKEKAFDRLTYADKNNVKLLDLKEKEHKDKIEDLKGVQQVRLLMFVTPLL